MRYALAWDLFLENVAVALNISSSMAGILCSLVSTAILDVILGVATESGLSVIIGSIIGIIFFVAVGWFPTWTGAILGIVFSVIFANAIRETIYG